MGSDGMAMMGEMEMPLPANTLPMMTGTGQFGPIEMGGMFTVMKVREDLAANDYKDPGPYKFPQGTVAYEVDAAGAPAVQKPSAGESPGMNMPGMKMPRTDMPGMNMPGMKHH
jgi:manganese oxidase